MYVSLSVLSNECDFFIYIWYLTVHELQAVFRIRNVLLPLITDPDPVNTGFFSFIPTGTVDKFTSLFRNKILKKRRRSVEMKFFLNFCLKDPDLEPDPDACK